MSIGYENNDVELPRAFIDHYMPRCAPVFALIYIYGLRQCVGGTTQMASAEIASVFNIIETDVMNAWQYWENEGLIKLDNTNGNMVITFLNVTEPKAAAEAKPKKSSAQIGLVKPDAPASRQKAEKRPNYTVDELSAYKQQCEDIKQLFHQVEESLGQMLQHQEMNLLFGFHDWLRLPVDVIGFLVSYCVELGHRDMRYIEKVALDWADKNIDSIEKADNYVQSFNKEYREILSMMGQHGKPSPTQAKYMNKWLKEYMMPPSLVLEACDRAAVSIGKSKFPYVDKIIEAWHKKGIKELNELEALDSEKPEKKARGAKPNRFSNFNHRERDYTELEKKEREYLEKELKEAPKKIIKAKANEL